MKIAAILLAGGIGRRMGCEEPKQFLLLNNKPIVHYSLEIFLNMGQIVEMIVVCPQQYRPLFSSYPVHFADPGKERQDSVYNGLCKVSQSIEWIIVHDGVRPFLTEAMLRTLLYEGCHFSASTFAMPARNTLKEGCENHFVRQTLNRTRIWEIQTPQLLKREIMEAGFAYLYQHQLSVTDDVSLAELMGERVKLILGSYQNIKITTPEDLDFAQWLIQKNIN